MQDQIDRFVEIGNQCRGINKVIHTRFVVPVPVVVKPVFLATRPFSRADRMGVVKAQNSFIVCIMQCQRIPQAMRSFCSYIRSLRRNLDSVLAPLIGKMNGAV